MNWSAGERLLALVIADIAYDTTRRTRRPVPRYVLVERTGYTGDSIRRVLQRLAERGFEFRVSHGLGRDGREVFSARGHAIDYEVPPMPKGGMRVPPLPFQVPVDNPEKGGTAVPPVDEKGGMAVPPVDEKGGTDGRERRDVRPAPRTNGTLTDTSVVGGAVEVASGALGQQQSQGVGGTRAPHRMSKIELAAWQAAESRRDRERQAADKTAPTGDEP